MNPNLIHFSCANPSEPRIAALAFFLCWSAWRAAELINEIDNIDAKDIVRASRAESTARILGLVAWVIALTALARWCFA